MVPAEPAPHGEASAQSCGTDELSACLGRRALRSARRRWLAAHGAQAQGAPPGAVRLPPGPLLQEAVLCYGQDDYPFVGAIASVLQEPAGCDLGRLHEGKLGREILGNFRRQPAMLNLGPRGNPWHSRFHSCARRDPEVFAAFMRLYHDFVRSFVLDNLDTYAVAFQAHPTFRCHLPGCGAPGRPHRDEDYRHPCCEINFWVPVTLVFDSNGLYAESSRGAGDFRPFQVSVGSCVRFYGNQVWHYCAPNETDTTRVSFDFRAIREEEWSPAAFAYPFQLGEYYSVMTREGLLPAGSVEMLELREAYQCALPFGSRLKMKEPGVKKADISPRLEKRAGAKAAKK